MMKNKATLASVLICAGWFSVSQNAYSELCSWGHMESGNLVCLGQQEVALLNVEEQELMNAYYWWFGANWIVFYAQYLQEQYGTWMATYDQFRNSTLSTSWGYDTARDACLNALELCYSSESSAPQTAANYYAMDSYYLQALDDLGNL